MFAPPFFKFRKGLSASFIAEVTVESHRNINRLVRRLARARASLGLVSGQVPSKAMMLVEKVFCLGWKIRKVLFRARSILTSE